MLSSKFCVIILQLGKKNKHGKGIFIDPKSYIYMWQKWDANLGLHKFKAYAILHMFTF